MTFAEWMETVPQALKGDPLWRMLLTIIPSERGYKRQEESVDYETDKEVLSADLLTNIPMPP